MDNGWSISKYNSFVFFNAFARSPHFPTPPGSLHLGKVNPTGSRHGSFSAGQGMVVLDPREMIGWHDVEICFFKIVCLLYLWEQGH